MNIQVGVHGGGLKNGKQAKLPSQRHVKGFHLGSLQITPRPDQANWSSWPSLTSIHPISRLISVKQSSRRSTLNHRQAESADSAVSSFETQNSEMQLVFCPPSCHQADLMKGKLPSLPSIYLQISVKQSWQSSNCETQKQLSVLSCHLSG